MPFAWLPPHTQRILSADIIAPPGPVVEVVVGAVIAVICALVVVSLIDALSRA